MAGKDSAERRFASPDELFADASASAAAWYSTSEAYWNGVSADVDGMLGGLGDLHAVDMQASLSFIDAIRAGVEGEQGGGGGGGALPDGVALDCGAGIGRVSRTVLLERFQSVELLEPSRAFLDRARQELPAGRVLAFHEAPLQGFKPQPVTSSAEGGGHGRYAAVWIQWVLNYLTDADLAAFLRRVAASLMPDGLVVVKESVSKECNGFYVDRSDSSITRTDGHFRRLFADAGLRVVACRKQRGMPRGTFAVWMYAFAP